MTDKKAYMYGLSAVLLWSTVATAFKLSLEHLSPVQLLFFATFSSLIVIFCMAWYQGKLHLLQTLGKEKVIAMLFLGCINPFAYYLVLFEAYDLLPAQEAQPLNYTWALTLSYLSVLILKHHLKWQDILAGLICYGGVFVISTRGNVFTFEFSDPLGVGLAIFSTILWALYWIYSTKWGVDVVIGLLLNFVSGFVLISIWLVCVDGFVGVTLKGVIGAIYVGIFEMGITFFLWLQAMRLTSQTAKIANLIFLSPFISLFFIWSFLGETILPSTLVGLGMIITGLLVQKYKKRVQ